MGAGSFEPTDRTTVRRHPERGRYEREVIAAILDEALYCHIGYVDGDGRPRVIPTIHARVGETVYIHGSTASRTLRAVPGAEVCLVVTLLDALVLARSAFSHSMNYRSVVAYGRARLVTDAKEKWAAQRALVEHVCAGRSEHVRMPNESELNQTSILAIGLEEASAKIRTGPPADSEGDYALPIWAGLLPIRSVAGPPEDDPRMLPGIRPPQDVADYRRPGS